ncbi:hypothetical protein COM87_28080 [Bacillus thuringiensis]|uniref:hypothetical protein n=1 Tax=Bacillus thuringiensis TaxID=1428 RepID=UPI000BEBF9A2|nr:hypothetical protein [Bacillus thuringiensis]PDY55775.1 hypothetical protein COM87_28080 [Bacillus thuringiensis]
MYYNQVPIPTYWRQDEVDLTGTWQGNDGSLYYIRQDGRKIWWVAMSDNGSGHTWTNVFKGDVKYDSFGGVNFSGSWYDVPRGIYMGNGILGFKVQLGNLVKTYQDKLFGANTLTKIA